MAERRVVFTRGSYPRWPRPGWPRSAAASEERRNVDVLERRQRREPSVVPISVYYGEVMAAGACSNQAVHARTNRHTGAPGPPVEIDGGVDGDGWKRRIDAGQRVHRGVCDLEGPLVIESLQNFLDDRQTGDHAFPIAHHLLERHALRTAKDLDPSARVNEQSVACVHDRHRGFPLRPTGDRLAWPRGRRPRGLTPQADRCRGPWSGGPFPRAPARSFARRCARRSPVPLPRGAAHQAQHSCVSCV